MRKAAAFVIAAAAIVGIALYVVVPKANAPAQITATPSLKTIEVVKGAAEQEKGLGGREEIPHEYGMLFVFPKADRYGFWMKDMLTSIDIIWLADDDTIVGIEENVPADSYPKIYQPTTPVSRVLETRVGEARLKGWSVGTKLTLPDVDR